MIWGEHGRIEWNMEEKEKKGEEKKKEYSRNERKGEETDERRNCGREGQRQSELFTASSTVTISPQVLQV